MAPAPDRERQPMVASESNRRDHVGYIDASRDRRGAAIDHSVVDFSCLVVRCVRGSDQIALKLRA
jgi:hypothetical protein